MSAFNALNESFARPIPPAVCAQTRTWTHSSFVAVVTAAAAADDDDSYLPSDQSRASLSYISFLQAGASRCRFYKQWRKVRLSPLFKNQFITLANAKFKSLLSMSCMLKYTSLNLCQITLQMEKNGYRKINRR